MHQRQDKEEALADLPGESPQAFKAQLGFIKAERHFDLPSSGIDQEDVESLLGGIDRFRSEQVPESFTGSLARDHQPEGLLKDGVEDREGQDADFAVAVPAGILNQALYPGAFAAGNLPGLLFDSVFIDQAIAVRSTDHEAHPSYKQAGQPGRASIATIKHMNDPRSKTVGQILQHLPLFFPLE